MVRSVFTIRKQKDRTMRALRIIPILVLLSILILPSSALAQNYYFQNPVRSVDVYWNEDGSQTLVYLFLFQNDPAGHAIEYVDLSLPNNNFDEARVTAWVNRQPISFISREEYQGTGSGVALGLGGLAIPPGGSGQVVARVEGIEGVLYEDDQEKEYASAVFAPAYFIKSVVYGTTEITVTFHLPPGVQPEEPRWHTAPSGFNDPPQTGIDEQGRIFYRWTNPSASPSELYKFGASFPKKYVPESAIVTRNPFAEWFSSINLENLIPLGCIGSFIFFIALGLISDRTRRMQYVPPKILLEGNGIKRGLTAIEAAILLEQPLDKVLTMILFSVVKKNAARVAKRDPLTLEFAQPQPEGLYWYETEFLEAFRSRGKARQHKLQELVIHLVKSVAEKMKGFSGRETREYYRSIIEKAWQQVEAAETPEVISQKYDEVMEWTMLDKDYEDRTRDIFRNRPVLVPTWWARYDPVYRGAAGNIPTRAAPTPSTGGRTGLPSLPGADFAASIVNGVQNFSASVIGNLTEFTSAVTQKTNPPPVASSRGSGGRSGGGGCACACACAGCACACAGGGR